jgi:hypothetical protein
MAKPKRPNLKKLLAKYQKRLRLQDFVIEARYASADELEDAFGRTRIRWHLGTATVLICEPSQITSDAIDCRNVELTLVHELLHIVLTPITDREPTGLVDEMQEQTIEKLARAIIGI